MRKYILTAIAGVFSLGVIAAPVVVAQVIDHKRMEELKKENMRQIHFELRNKIPMFTLRNLPEKLEMQRSEFDEYKGFIKNNNASENQFVPLYHKKSGNTLQKIGIGYYPDNAEELLVARYNPQKIKDSEAIEVLKNYASSKKTIPDTIKVSTVKLVGPSKFFSDK